MPRKAVGRAAAGLPWLCPNTDGLIRLAEDPAGLARLSAAPGADVALLAFLLRFAPASQADGLFCPNALLAATLPETAAAHLRAAPHGWLDPDSEVVRRCGTFARAAGAFAHRLAEHTRRACPDRAAALAAMAPLGLLAVAAVDPCLTREPPRSPDEQAEAWGLDANAIARRLAYRWRFPNWLASALGNFSLPLAVARTLVGDAGLFAVVQLAVVETERRGPSLGLAAGASRAELLAELKLDDARVQELWPEVVPESEPGGSGLDLNPHRVPLVANLLNMAGESRRRNGASVVARLEDRLDDLHRAVVRVNGEGDDRTRDAKLEALAELAAGAGHEINNPLAVISTHAQRLFRTEPDPERGAALQSVIRQTHRISGIVRDLMQFARPPRPSPHRLDATDLVSAVTAELTAFAAERDVRLERGPIPVGVAVRADRGQLAHALVAVVRNAIEAAGPGGWVRVGCPDDEDESVRFVVEDSGPGLTAEAREHAFDPFFCGRSAGRGRGLGLPTAWRLARQNGGDVRHEPTDGPTRFVITAPRSVALGFIERQSA